jgi:hypothetical protein
MFRENPGHKTKTKGHLTRKSRKLYFLVGHISFRQIQIAE